MYSRNIFIELYLLIVLFMAATSSQAAMHWNEDFDGDPAAISARWPSSMGSGWVSSGLFTLSTEQHVSGTRSLKGTYLGPNGGGFMERRFPSTQDLWERYYIFFENFSVITSGDGSAGTKNMFVYGDASASFWWMIGTWGKPQFSIVVQTAVDRTDAETLNQNMNAQNWTNGVWYCVEQHIRLNDIGVANGVIEMWVDGIKRMNYTGRMFTNKGNTFNSVRHYRQHGLGNIYWDDHAVGDTRIGCDGIVIDTIVPAAPANLSAVTKSLSQIDLSWSDNSANETRFEIERKISPTGTWTLVDTISANRTSYTVNGLGANHTFYFRVRAVNIQSGSSAPSNEVSVTTSASAIIAEEMVPQGQPIRSPVLEIHGGNVRFTLPGSGSYTLSVYDLVGRKVWNLERRPTRASVQNIKMGRELMDGIYVAKLVMDDRQIVQRFTVIR